jgi:hypothetical protein
LESVCDGYGSGRGSVWGGVHAAEGTRQGERWGEARPWKGRGKAVATKCSRSWGLSVAMAGVDAGYSFVAR